MSQEEKQLGGQPPEPPQIKGSKFVKDNNHSQVDTKKVVPDKEQIAIRTMQDDMRPSAQTGAIKSKAISRETVTPMPLPPKDAEKAKKVILKPLLRKKRKKFWPKIILGAITVIIIGSVSAGVWLWISSNKNSSEKDKKTVFSAAQVLPADFTLLIKYDLSSAANRSAILSAWKRDVVSASDLIQGNPTTLLDDPDINEVYYVLVKDNPRPFLLFPKTLKAKEDFSNIKIAEYHGWYIAHALNVKEYIDKVDTKTLDSIGTPAVLSANISQAPLRIVIDASQLLQLRTNVLGKELANGTLQELSLAGRFVAQNKGIELSGTGSTVNTIIAGTANQQLLSKIPPSAKFVRLGSNFIDDLTKWSPIAGVLDQTIINRPNVQSLLSQLNQSYVVYTDNQADAVSYGLIIELPVSLQGSLKIGDKALETFFSSITPLLTGRKAVVPISFNNGEISQTILRYANIAGSSQALDYTIVDKYIVFASSKKAMTDLVNTFNNNATAINSSDQYRSLISMWGALPVTRDLVFGTINMPNINKMLPVDEQQDIFFGFATQKNEKASGVRVQSILQISTPQKQPSF